MLFVGSLVHHLLLRNFGRYGIIFMNVCGVTTVAVVMVSRDFKPYEIILMNVRC